MKSDYDFFERIPPLRRDDDFYLDSIYKNLEEESSNFGKRYNEIPQSISLNRSSPMIRNQTLDSTENPQMDINSPLGRLRRRDKIYVNDKAYKTDNDKRSNKTEDNIYNLINNQIKDANIIQKQMFAMLSNKLAKDKDLKRINITDKPLGNGVLGRYYPNQQNIDIYTEKFPFRNPIGTINHEMLHAELDKNLQENRNPGLLKDKFTYDTAENYFKNIKDKFDSESERKNKFRTIYRGTQNILDPTGIFRKNYPVDKVALDDLNDDNMMDDNFTNDWAFNAPDELSTHLIDRIGQNKPLYIDRGNQRARSLTKKVINNTSDTFKRLHEDGFENYRELGQAFKDSYNQVNNSKSYKQRPVSLEIPQKVSSKFGIQYK